MLEQTVSGRARLDERRLDDPHHRRLAAYVDPHLVAFADRAGQQREPDTGPQGRRERPARHLAEVDVVDRAHRHVRARDPAVLAAQPPQQPRRADLALADQDVAPPERRLRPSRPPSRAWPAPA